jgi:hypothetical protein
MGSKKAKSLLFAALPLILAVLIMIPRLTSAQFGFLDDGFILSEVRAILNGDLSMRLDFGAGRFRPLYWLYFTLIYALAGPNPFWFFTGHLVILLILLLEIRALMKHLGGHDWQILLASLVFLFSIPIIENFYTLSKGEPLQLIFILGALLCLEKLKRSTRPQTTWTFSGLASISLLAAIWSKETAYIMLPLAVVWAAFVLYQRKHISAKELRANFIFLGATLAATMLNLLVLNIWSASPAAGDTYTSQYSLNLMSIIARVPRWMTLYAFYFHYLLPLTVMAMMILFIKENSDSRIKHDLVVWGGWVLAWSVGFFPWEFAEVYYLLPVSVGISIIAGLLLPHIRNVITSDKTSMRWLMGSMSVLFVVLFLASLTHYRTHALTQISIDQMNRQMLNTIRDQLPEDGDLIMGVNTYNEYVQNLGHFLIDQDGMTTITYDFVSLEVLMGIESRSEAILLLPYIEHQPRLLLRAGVEEEFTMAWVEEIQQTLEGQLQPLAQPRSTFQINNINLPVIACPILGSRGFCEHPDPFLDTRLFSYGWDIYTIK